MKISARPHLALQRLQQIDDLRLDRHVERRHRLVADDQLRLEDHRPRDADALALAAGELVRIAVDHLRRRPTFAIIACTRCVHLAFGSSGLVRAQRLAR